MARSREFDDAAVVRAARDLFWERGYSATSLARLQLATGLSKSSLYEAYGNKRGLFDRAAVDYLDEIVASRLAPLEAPHSGLAELVGYFAALADHFRGAPRSIATRGCLLINTATELTDLDESAAALVRDYRSRVRDALLGSIRTAVESGDLVAEDPARTAEVLTTGLVGLFITSRFDPALAADIADGLVADLRKRPTATPRRSPPGRS